MEKNPGLTEAYKLGRGDGITEPRDIEIYSFSPCTSVEIERFFSVLQGFLENRNNIREGTLLKLLFVQYNRHNID